ncbi:MAG: hypothetical protein KGI50_07715 [Patescibacteria group bacterium]|nr:hypothetical protein [Patescibacteria group bacterium]
MSKENKMIGYKGFDKNWKCRDMQYEIDKTYEHKGEINLCESGLHFVEDPLDALAYYDPCDGHFAEIEAYGVSAQTETDSKRVASKITVKAEINFKAICDGAIKFLYGKIDFLERVKKASGDESKLAASGNKSNLAASGDESNLAASGNASNLAASGYASNLAASGYASKLAASGDESKIEMTGERSIAAGIGMDSMAKGKSGCWIVLAEWKNIDQKWTPINVVAVKIDGKKIKADTWYQLKNGKFVEADGH